MEHIYNIMGICLVGGFSARLGWGAMGGLLYIFDYYAARVLERI